MNHVYYFVESIFNLLTGLGLNRLINTFLFCTKIILRRCLQILKSI